MANGIVLVIRTTLSFPRPHLISIPSRVADLSPIADLFQNTA